MVVRMQDLGTMLFMLLMMVGDDAAHSSRPTCNNLIKISSVAIIMPPKCPST